MSTGIVSHLEQRKAFMDSRGFQSLYYEGPTGAILAGRDGSIYALEDGVSDAGLSFPLWWISKYRDQGHPNNRKSYQDLVIEHNTTGTLLIVELVTDNGANTYVLGTIQSTIRTQTVFPINQPEGISAKNAAVFIHGDSLATTQDPTTIFGCFLHYYLEARGALTWDSDELDFGTQRVKNVRAIEIDCYNPAEITVQIQTDLPGNNMAARASKTVPGSSSRRKYQVPIPEYVEGRHVRVLIYSSNQQEFQLYGARAWVQTYGTYMEAYEIGNGQRYDSFQVDFGTRGAARARELELDLDTDGAVNFNLLSDLPGNNLASKRASTVNTTTTTPGRRKVRLPLTPHYPEGHLWQLQLTGSSALRLYGARLDIKPYGEFVESYESADGRIWDSDILDLGTPKVKEFREVQLDVDTDGSLTIDVLTDLPGSDLAVRRTLTVDTTTTTAGRRMVNLPFPMIEGRLLQLRVRGSAAWRLYAAWVFARPIGYYVEAYQAAAGHIWDSTEHDFGMPNVKRILQLELEIHNDSPATLETSTNLAQAELLLRDTQTIPASTTRRTWIVPFQSIYGRLARWKLSSTAAFRLFRVRALVKPIGVYLNGSTAEVFPVESEQDLRTERVKLWKEIELVYDAASAGTLAVSTELPSGTVLPMQAFSLPATTGTQTLKLRLPGHAKGRLIRLEARPGASDLQIFAIRVWTKVLGEASGAGWSWITLPIPATPDNYAWSEIYVAPTPPAWEWGEIFVPKTPIDWAWVDFPVEKTPELPAWVDLPVQW